MAPVTSYAYLLYDRYLRGAGRFCYFGGSCRGREHSRTKLWREISGWLWGDLCWRRCLHFLLNVMQANRQKGKVISFAAVFRDVTQRSYFRRSVAWHSKRRLPRRLSEGQWKRKTNVKRSEVLVNLKKPVQFSVPCHIEGHINNKKLQNRLFS